MTDITEILLVKRTCSVCDGNGFKTDGRHCGGCNGSGETMQYGHVGQRASAEINRVREMLAAAEADADRLAEALRAYVEYHAMPSDRGGKNGPKGKAFTRFASLRDAALTAHQERKASAHD